jgi:hypothetical protein
VPAVAVIRRGQALSGIIGRKEFVDCIWLLTVKAQSLTLERHLKRKYLSAVGDNGILQGGVKSVEL